ncbi:MAG TPA: S8 family serine peptidase [Rudaea sp.]|nr:S8 family serine peptidase [Rudaea sp.]
MKTKILVAAVAVALAGGMSDLRAGNPLAQPAKPADTKVAGPSLPAVLDLQLDTYRSAGDEHKFIVARDSTYRSAAASGKAVDYDTFSLVRMAGGVAGQAVEGAVLADRMNLILLNSGVLDTTGSVARERAQRSYGKPGGTGMALVQFSGPIRPEWYAALSSSGVDIVTPIPENAYLVYGRTETLQQLGSSLASRLKAGAVQYAAPYAEAERVDPEALKVDAQGGLLSVQLFADATVNAETLAVLGNARIVQDFAIGHYRNLVVEVSAGQFAALAAQPDVVSIQSYATPQKMDERQDRIITGQLSGNNPVAGSHLQWLADHGFTQAQFDNSGFLVNLTDSGIDNGTASPNHFALHVGGVYNGASRIVYNRLVGTPHAGSTLAGQDGHGTLNSHVIGGFVGPASPFNAAPHSDASGFRYDLGVAPFVKIGSSVIFDPGTYTNPNLSTLESQSYTSGSRISSNSWGASSNSYSSDAQTFDTLVRDAQSGVAGNQEMVVVFAAGNAGPGANTVGTPGTAKNVITAGASENVQAFGGPDQCGTTDAEADSANDIVGFSSRGPTSDGRKKPDLVAPGTHVTGGVWQSSPWDPAVTLNGGASPTFDATGVCAGPGTSNFFPTGGQQWYTASSGTSHSTPAIAGAAALTRQWFINQALTPPSPAMTKAFLTNAAHYMNGTGANDTLPSNNQGLGLLDLDRSFDGVSRILSDEDAGKMFTASGQTRVFTGQVTDATKPLRITLAWTDKAGPTSGAAWINNLDLTVSVNGTTYKGNVFSGGNSVSGGSADPSNNLESVFLPAGLAAGTPVAITITATNIAGDGVPGNASALDQDFALVGYDVQAMTFPVVVVDSLAQASENGTPANGVPDPGELVSYDLALRNVGTANTTDVEAQLQPTGGVVQTDSPRDYGVLLAAGAATSRNFPFLVDPGLICGAPLVLTWNLSDAGNPLGSVVKNLTVGGTSTTTTPIQNFDGVTAPALPSGWVNANTGAGNPWVTTTTTPNSAPNAAFTDDPGAVSDKRLTTQIAVPAAAESHLKFRQKYDLESGSGTTAYDAAVLEISLDGGTTFNDIVAAGGSFVTGSYPRTVSTCCSNPLASRQAWSGNTATYQDADVLLPASTSGQNVQFRWRVGSDSTVGKTGYWLDDVQLVSLLPSCATSPPSNVDLAVTARNQRVNLPEGQSVMYTVTVNNVGASPTANARVLVPVPAGLSNFSSWTCTATGSGSCATASGIGAIDATVSLAAGESATFSITADVGTNEQMVDFTATVTPPLGQIDTNTLDNTATDSDQIVLFANGFDDVPPNE